MGTRAQFFIGDPSDVENRNIPAPKRTGKTPGPDSILILGMPQ